MPKRKKQPKDMTTEEIAKAIFPKKLHEKLKEIAHEKDSKSRSKLSSQ
ncbi:MAG: hypothetical protein JXB43_06200 [Dehalococcoidia bacterium]|nr:hypothetical protein [Dehalococcoidia bacterium]